MTIAKRQKGIKYAKIPKKHKVLFLKKVIEDKSSLKSTAKLFKINYSTAKTLVRQFRQDTHILAAMDCSDTESTISGEKNQNLKRCGYKQHYGVSTTIKDFDVIKFSYHSNLQENQKRVKKYGLIIQNCIQNRKSSGIQIVSKILFS